MLELSKITMHLKFNTPAVFPRWLGSAFRGGFGEHLRRACCSDVERGCRKCNSNNDCVYYYIYERESATRGYAPPTRPVIIVPPFFGRELEFKNGCRLNVDIYFFGKFRKYLPHTLLGIKLLGFTGIGGIRRYNMNRFTIESAECAFSGEKIYDGETIKLTKLKTLDISDPELYNDFEGLIEVGFRTPIILKSSEFPPSPQKLLEMIRSRLILYVNEYGDGSTVDDFTCKGEVIPISKHFHELERRSRRTGARRFDGYTGIARYRFEGLDDVGKWLLSVGALMGAGPRSAFGCGFLTVKEVSSTEDR